MRFLTLILLFLPLLSYSQDPVHVIVGEGELEGHVVLSILQDERANIWVSTSGGLFRYDGYDFKSYRSSKMVSTNALHGLTQDHEKNIYCYNTVGQIFKVGSDSLELYYTLPDSVFNNYYYIEFDNKNNLLISGKNVYVINQKKEISLIHKQRVTQATPLTRKEDNSVVFYSSNGNDLFTYKNEKLKPENTIIDFGQRDFYYSIFSGDTEFLAVRRSSHLYKRKGNSFERVKHGVNIGHGCLVFVDSDEDIWILQNKPGIYLISDNPRMTRYSGRKLFPAYTVSTKFEDKDGNIWLGTFGKGLIQISNKQNQISYNSTLSDYDEFKSISKDNDNRLIVGTLNGNLHQYNSGKLVLLDSFPGRIDIISFDQYTKDFYFGNRAFNLQDGIYRLNPYGSVRNISFTQDSLTIITAFNGIFINDHSSNPKKYVEEFRNLGFQIYEDQYFKQTSRLLSVNYDTRSKILWVGGTSKLNQISANGEEEFKYNGKSIVALDMERVDGDLFISTQKNGVLILRDNKIHKALNTENGLLSNAIGKIKIENGKLFMGSRDGLQVMDIKTGVFTNFTIANGKKLRVRDFEIVENVAYVIHRQGLQTIQLGERKQSISAPILDFTSIVMDGKDRRNDKQLSIDHDKNNIVFNFAAKTYNNRDQLVYNYKIEGINDDWITHSFDENTIKLIGLDHGSYILSLYAIDARGQKSNTLTYSFSVHQPFWLAWWFFAIIVAIAFVSVILFYRRLLRIQEMKAQRVNELNASRLTAIQSQMNPHFIFNALNSIQYLVIQGDIDNSYTFISKFANLLRKTLSFSDKDFIEFDQEVQMLELYLSLEKLRFEADFDYTIETNGITDIMIPPMLIQPFIENALVHGLLHKKGHKQLDISFELNEYLICKIVDNGIGRTKAGEIKTRQNSKHESFAVKAIEKRLGILQEIFGADIGFKYLDNEDKGESVGTTVVIKMPVKTVALDF